MGYTPSKMKFVFRGVDSPEVQNILLQGAQGVMVDNIALRGSSGTMFKKVSSGDLSKTYSDLNPQLVILQFGGNSVPYVTDEKSAKAYGNYFQAQIQYLKKLLPSASFLVIGPSDMSTSVDGVYQSWAGVSLVRDAMKEAAFAESCGFWDMYEVMGGKNSMVSWVSNTPPYAGPDYTHFTPLGARKMAELLYKSIHKEYEMWKAEVR
jgi:lysophospholipase L1-like esterase